MRFFATLCFFGLFCALLFPLVGTMAALPAYAGDGRDKPARDDAKEDGQNAVAQLTTEELDLLKQKLPKWDELDAGKQNRIARHVLRLRAMGPEERQRFQERMERLRDAKRRHGPDAPGGRDRGKHPSVVMAVFGQAIESMLNVDWPAGSKLAAEHKWSGAQLASSFVRHALMRRIGDFEAERALADGVDLDTHFKDLPESRRAKLTTALEKARKDPRARSMIGRMLFHWRIRAVSVLMTPSDRSPQEATQESRTARVVQQIRERWTQPYTQALDDVRTDPAAFVKRVEMPMRALEWVSLASKLDEVATRTAKADPALAKDADALFVRILRDRLKVSADKIAALPPRGTPQRRRAFRKLFGDRMGRGQPGAGPGKAGNRRGGRPFGRDRKEPGK